MIEAFGSTSLVQVGSYYYLDSISTGSGPELKYGGSPVAAGQFGSWTPIGAEQTASGYEVAWKVPGTDQYSIWFTDSSGNETVQHGRHLREQHYADIAGKQLPSGSQRRRHHRSGGYDDDDRVVWVDQPGPGRARNFFLDSISTGTGPELQYGGAPVAAGQFGSWTPIGAEQTAGGYEVAWKLPGTDQYSVWFTDSSGNETVQHGRHLREQHHTDVAGKQLPSGSERRRHHRPDSYDDDDRVVWVDQPGRGRATNFFLDSISTGTGPELQYGGAPVAAGQFGSWTPIGAEQTAGGYEVAWKLPGTDQYSVWFTDSSGNETVSTGGISGTSTALMSHGKQLPSGSERRRHHRPDSYDNDDRVVWVDQPGRGRAAISILDSISSGTGPELQYGGAPVAAGQFGSWTPIGTEQTAGGYEVAWKLPGTDQYSIWFTDSSGNETVSTGGISGTSTALMSL